MGNKVTEYIYMRIQQLSSTNNLTLYHWNKGDDKTWKQYIFPNDAHLLMTLFCRYMDDAMCPAIKFSEKHYFEITLKDIKKIDKLYKKFKDIAIICVSDMKYLPNMMNRNTLNNFNDPHNGDITAQDSLPYFFIAFNKKKFEKKIKSISSSSAQQKSSLVQKPRHFLYSAWNQGVNIADNSFNNYLDRKNEGNEEIKSDFSEDEEGGVNNQYNKYRSKQNKKKHKKERVGTWFPEPGKNNLLHTITLFALFLHRCCNDKLTDIGLKDQGCNLLEPILR